MSYELIPLTGKYLGYTGVLDTETLFVYRVSDNNPVKLGEPVNNTNICNEEKNGFDTLILHVSNTCNLRCKYCFAGHGSYKSERGMMSPDIAIMAIRQFYKKYGYIREIKFFGGEPAMNLQTMESVLQFVTDLKNQNEIDTMPVFKIITNGTVMNKKFIELVKQYWIKVVFSIDGPPMIHDEGRIYPNESPTFEIVKHNFWKLRHETEDLQPYSIDVTYSHIHEKNNVSIHNVVTYMTKTFQVKPQKVNVSIVTDVLGDHTIPLQNPCAMSQSALDALSAAENGDLQLHMKLKAIVRMLKNRNISNNNICSAAGTWAAVSTKGDVYPCLMFMDRPEYCMGNVTENFFTKAHYENIYSIFQTRKKIENPECSACSFRNLCSVCMGLNEAETGSLYHSSAQTCEERKKMIMTAVKGIAEGVF